MAKSSSGFSDEELKAMKQRAAELRAEKTGGAGAAKKAREAKACDDAIAALNGSDKEIATKLHQLVTDEAPHLDPKTWYGFPSYARDGKVVVFFQPKEKFGARYGTVGFNDAATLDDGEMWPVAFAVTKVTTDVEKRLRVLVKACAR